MDLIVGVVVFVSGITAFARGGLREATTAYSFLGATFGAALITYLSSDWLFSSFSGGMAIGLIVGGWMALFIVITLVQLANFRAEPWLGEAEVGKFDRFVGLVFGCFRGLVVCGLLFLVLTQAAPATLNQRWVSGAHSYSLVASTAEALSSLVDSPGAAEGPTGPED